MMPPTTGRVARTTRHLVPTLRPALNLRLHPASAPTSQSPPRSRLRSGGTGRTLAPQPPGPPQVHGHLHQQGRQTSRRHRHPSRSPHQSPHRSWPRSPRSSPRGRFPPPCQRCPPRRRRLLPPDRGGRPHRRWRVDRQTNRPSEGQCRSPIDHDGRSIDESGLLRAQERHRRTEVSRVAHDS